MGTMRSVCVSIAEAWRKRRYPNKMMSMLSHPEQWAIHAIHEEEAVYA